MFEPPVRPPESLEGQTIAAAVRMALPVLVEAIMAEREVSEET